MIIYNIILLLFLFSKSIFSMGEQTVYNGDTLLRKDTVNEINKTKNIYIQTWIPANRTSEDRIRLVNPSDSNYVKFIFYGDMGIISSAYFEFKKNIPDGKYLVYINDRLDRETTFKRHKKNGPAHNYYSSGEYDELFYKNDTISGIVKSYFSNGDLNRKSFFYKGKIKLRIIYEGNKQLLSNEFYINDSLVRYERFNTDGSIKVVWKEGHIERAQLLIEKFEGKRVYDYINGVFEVTYNNNQIINWTFTEK
jgi:antitoxin component YwqK of YwqJK toxin-antitoxin module